MALHAICGVMGSGKSFESVKEKILPALVAGRRVISNVEGLNFQAIADYTKKSLEYVKAHLIVVTYDRVSEPGFWYDPEGGVTDSIVQPGDLVVLDEVWRYYGKGVKLPPDVMRFFRMHRHYVHAESYLACDVVLINQAIRGLHADIRDIVELVFQCRKLKSLGRPKNYQVSMIEGGTRTASHKFLRSYDKAIFPLYSSYAGTAGKEDIDKRQSVFSTPFFKFVLPLFFIAGSYAGWFVYHHFKTLGQPAGAAAAVKPVTPASGAAAAPGAASAPPAPSASDWRLVARYYSGGLPVALLVDEKGRYRTITSGAYSQGAGDDVSLSVSDPVKGRATPWSGPPAPFSTIQQQPSANIPK